MTQLPPSNDRGGRRRRRSTRNRRPSDVLNDFSEPAGDGFWYLTDGSEPQRAGFNPPSINELNQTYQRNPVPNSPRPAGMTASPFPQVPPSTQAINRNPMTAPSTYLTNATPGPMSVLASAFKQVPSYTNQFPPSRQPAGPVNIPRQPLVNNGRPPASVIYEPRRQPPPIPQSAPAVERPPPCGGHPAPGWCYKCKWHYTSCDQIAHFDDRYCFHCMKSGPWDGEERRD